MVPDFDNDEGETFAYDIRSILIDCGWSGSVYLGLGAETVQMAPGVSVQMSIDDMVAMAKTQVEWPVAVDLRSSLEKAGIKHSRKTQRSFAKFPLAKGTIEVDVGAKP